MARVSRQALLFSVLKAVVQGSLALVLAYPVMLNAQQLPPVTGVVFDGSQITWNELAGATGYNIHGENFVYLDTVKQSTSFSPVESGRYFIVGFDDAGNFSPIQIIENDIVPTSNSVLVVLPANGLSPPANARGVVYSVTAGEIFWGRAVDQVLEYDVFLGNDLIGSSTGTSFFFEGLQPGVENRVSVIAKDRAGASSEPVSLLFDTSQPDFPAAARDHTIEPGKSPEPPRNVLLDVYSDSAAELFWERPPSDEMVVQTEISRNREILGLTDGTSFFDNTRAAGILYTYRLVAIDAEGNRSEPAIVNPGPFDGASDETIARLLQGISEVTRNNPHVRWFPYLRGLTRSPLPEDLTEISSESLVSEDGTLLQRTQFNCSVGGRLAIDSFVSRFGAHRLTFEDCNIDRIYFDGSVFINGTDLGGHSTRYEGLLIAPPVSDEFSVLDGAVSLTVFRSNNGMVLNYQQLTFFIDNLDDGSSVAVELNQRLTDVISSLAGDTRNTVQTNFTVTAPWTLERRLTVTTDREFSGADEGSGNPTTGLLTATTDTGERLQLDADTGDDSTFMATVFTDESTTDQFGSWNDSTRLPCVSFTRGDEAIPGCLGIREAIGLP